MKNRLYTEGYTIVLNDTMQNGRALMTARFKYEPHIKNWIYRNAPGKVFIDVGASYGIHVLNAARAGAEHVYAFEVIPEVYKCLLETVKLNSLQDKVTCYNVAIGDSEGESHLLKDIDDNGMMNWDNSGESGRKVPVKPLLGYLENLPPEDTIFLMDVEGSEFKVMLGIADYIKKYKPRIVFEILRFCFTKDEIADNIQWLSGIGYGFQLFDRPNQTGLVTNSVPELLNKIDEMKDGVMDIELIP